MTNQYKFQQALNRLKNFTLHIDEISEALGYSETSMFTRAFRKWTGMSPGKFRSIEKKRL